MLEKQTKAVLAHSLTSGVFIDTRFYLFSRRTRKGTLDTRLPIYAHSSSLTKAADYFNSCES